ncbi:putative cyclin-dependent kinase F-2 [Tanacetum coccineum]
MDGTLADHVRRLIDKVPTETKVLRDVVEALLELHAGGVLHRNICPENVLLSTSTRADYISRLHPGPIAADIVEKLMNPSYRYDKIFSLKEASDEIFAGSLPDIEYLAGKVFEGD